MIVPLLNKPDGDFRLHLCEQRPFVQSHAGGGVLWRQTDGQYLLNSSVDDLTYSFGNKRFPVAHTHVHREAEFALHGLSLAQCDLSQWRLANQRIAMPYLFHRRVWNGPPAGDVLEELGDLRGRIRAAMRKEQNCCFVGHHRTAPVVEYLALNSLTKFTRARTFSTGVSGRIPCPRLKMCPARPPAWARISEVRARNSFWSANKSTGSRFP